MSLPSLRILLRANALYSVVTGGLAVALRQEVAAALAIAALAVVVLGIGLVGFGIAVGWSSGGARATPEVGLLIAGSDAVWVVAVAVFIVVAQPPASGVALAVAVSIPVAVLAVSQAIAALRMTRLR